MKFDRRHLLLYAVTDSACIGQRDFFAAVESALRGGVTMVQLREKGLSTRALTDKAKRLKEICAAYGAPLIVNDDYRAALEAGADGVHVGLEDTAVPEIRKAAGSGFLIGATAKTIGQAQSAQAAGADYLGVGAVFPSPTKQNAVRITAAQLAEIAGSVTVPVCAIGGITAENIGTLNGCGAAGFALVSAVFAAEDITTRCRTLRALAEQLCTSEGKEPVR